MAPPLAPPLLKTKKLNVTFNSLFVNHTWLAAAPPAAPSRSCWRSRPPACSALISRKKETNFIMEVFPLDSGIQQIYISMLLQRMKLPLFFHTRARNTYSMTIACFLPRYLKWTNQRRRRSKIALNIGTWAQKGCKKSNLAKLRLRIYGVGEWVGVERKSDQQRDSFLHEITVYLFKKVHTSKLDDLNK